MKNKRAYTRPEITKVTIDKEISMVMMSFGPGNDPSGRLLKSMNPLRWLR
jgi:hypothetical protein